MRVHLRHVRAAFLCANGLRGWCRANGVDLRRLCREGLPVDEFAHLQADPFAQAVIEAARREAADA